MPMPLDNRIILLVGESGAGKSTVADELCKRFGSRQVYSYTTRPRRTPDEKGHTFVSEKYFDTIVDQLVAYTEFDGYRYGVTKEQIDKNDIYVIDPAGIEYFEAHYDGDKPSIAFYITAPENLRRDRMLRRGDKPLDVSRRLLHDEEVFKNVMSLVDLGIINTDLEETIDWIYTLAYGSKEGENNR